MSSKDRRSYLTATVLDQALLDACHDNLECRIEMVVEIETPTGTIYASDRNKYVGGTFYEALLNFPTISRTVGEWLSNAIQFSTLTLELANADGRFNNFLPSGADFGGWVGRDVTVKLGLAELSASYQTIFKGKVTDIGGFKRTTKSIIVVARDNYDRLNVTFPSVAMSEAAYPKIEVANIGKILPVIYGDWTTDTDPDPAAIPAFAVNGNDPFVMFKEIDVFIPEPATPCTLQRVNHDLDDDDIIQLTTSGTLPGGFATGTTYYVVNSTADTFQLSLTLAGAAINTSGAGSGSHKFVADPSAAYENIQYRISDNDLVSFDTTNVWLKRNDVWSLAPAADITNVGAGNKTFELIQNTANLWVTPADGGTAIAYTWESGDSLWVRCQGKDVSTYDDNIVAQARDILITYGGLSGGDFNSNWDTYRDKSSPAESAIANFVSRVWIQEPKPVIEYALSMLEQVRLEAFIDRDLKLKINALHFEDWDATPTYSVKNWDVERGSFKASIDERNNFNRGQGFFNYLPTVKENAFKTGIYKNSAAITQTGKKISKRIEYPNLYRQEDVEYQLIEMLKLASATLEVIDCNLTWRAVLKDIGEFVFLDVQIGSSLYEGVPCMIRDIGYDPDGLKVPVKVWSTMMVPFSGYAPGYAGTVGGATATIVSD